MSQQLFNTAQALLKQKRLSEARATCALLLQAAPRNPQALELMAIIQLTQQDFAGAVGTLEARVKLPPVPASVHLNLGVALRRSGQTQKALAAYAKAAQLDPQNPLLQFNLGNLSAETGNLEAAAQHYQKAIALKPEVADVHCNLGNVLKAQGKLGEALACYGTAIALRPGYAEALSNRGVVLHGLGRFGEALTSLEQALQAQPQFAEAHNHRGNALFELRRLPEALESYDRAIALKPDLAEAYRNRGYLLSKNRVVDRAYQDFDRALALGYRADFLPSYRLHEKMRMCLWDNFNAEVKGLTAGVAAGEAVATPFAFMGLVDSPALQQRAAELYVAGKHPPVRDAGFAPDTKDKITIGYFSGDFHDHPMLFLMAEVFEFHDREKFRIVGFSFGPEKPSSARERVLPHFDAFHDVRNLADAEIRALARREGIDIAVDRKGYTDNSRTDLFAAGLAPVHVNYLAYPGTMGAPYIDYLVADPVLIPDQARGFYTEKIAYMPQTYQPNDRKRAISERVFTRAELGLPEDAFVYCCFNNNWKITPDVFAIWMRILTQAPKSVLWLYEENPFAVTNLKDSAARLGVDPGRLIFAQRMPLPEHLARHRHADLFLDTLPYTAHTTASDALWAGLPVLTRMGQSFTARVAASLLKAAELPDMVVETEADYEAKALAFYVDRAALAAVKARLAANRLTCPLFDSRRYVKDLESLYTQMIARYRAELKPDHIYA